MVPLFPHVDADPVAAGVLVGAMAVLAIVYFVRHARTR
jgi:hypothetical protein